MSCPRYHDLYSLLSAAGHVPDREHDRVYRDRLDRLRAHREICADCQADFALAFPELAGRQLTIESMIGEK